MTRESIENVAEGCVWTGDMAKEFGLADALGGIERAIEVAVVKSGIEHYSVKSYPSKESLFQNFFGGQSTSFVESQIIKSKLGNYYNDFNFLRNIEQRNMIQARIPFEINMN